MTKQEVIDFINEKLQVPVTLVSKIKDSFLKVLDFSSQTAVDDVIPDWTAVLIFQTDGSDAGKYCLHPDSNGKKRIFETKIDDNENNEPPTDPEVTENASWVEISQSAGSGISEWQAGVYGSGLVIVFHDHSVDGPGLYKLVAADRPYDSSDIEAEITAGDWEMVGVSKEYVDDQISSTVTGTAWKAPVKARTTEALTTNTADAGYTTLTSIPNTEFLDLDGVDIQVGDHVLVADEADAKKNGIYTLTQLGSGGTPWILTRRSDADSTEELQNAVVSVDEGTLYADTSWRQQTDGVVIGTSNIVWGEFTEEPEPVVIQKKVTVSSAQLLDLFDTPVELIQAPGAGKLNRIIQITFRLLFGTTAYDQGAGNLRVTYEGSALSLVSFGTSFLEHNADRLLLTSPAAQETSSDLTDTAIILDHTSADPTLGDGTLEISILYQIVDFN